MLQINWFASDKLFIMLDIKHHVEKIISEYIKQKILSNLPQIQKRNIFISEKQKTTYRKPVVIFISVMPQKRNSICEQLFKEAQDSTLGAGMFKYVHYSQKQ
ncbi:Hypothetical_protein [Hexamita inflata]|uniref:Hypothetical_protein n=1 Tax=Hexamita inflata TaxID=28002 RepID=A0AA86V2S9_9EUKA|nr:Hypothetical protein HINF_LOCUS61621 [Hexamita inflata]